MKMKHILLLCLTIMGNTVANAQTEVDSLRRNPRGVYKLMRVVGKMGEVNAPYDTYKICTDSVSLHMQIIYNKRWSILRADKEVLNYTGDKHNSSEDKNTLIYDSNEKQFTLKWWNHYSDTDPVFERDAWNIEYYESGKYTPVSEVLFDAITSPIENDESNPFIGVWRTIKVTTDSTDAITGWGRAKAEYPQSKIFNRSYMRFSPSHVISFVHTKTEDNQSITRGYVGKVQYWGKDSLSDEDVLYHVMWKSEDDIILHYKINNTDVYMMLERLHDKTPLIHNIASHYVSHDFNWFMEKANQGDSYAQSVVGCSYLQGSEDVKQDLEKAYHWLSKAAEQGQPEAEMMVGAFYLDGIVVERDIEKGIEWTKKAADHGQRHAQKQMGYYYMDDSNKDDEKAFSYMLKAAEQDEPEAQNEVGVMYAKGKGTEKNDAKAVEWYKKAAENGNVWAQGNLASRYENGNGVEKDPQKAFQWYLKAAEQGNASAQNNVAWKYYTADGVEQDYDKAFEWAVKSVEGNDPYGYGTLAELYYKGCGVAKDKQKAFELYSKGAELEDTESMRMLAIMYKKGEGTKKDKAKAAYWQKKYEETIEE